MKGLGPPFKGPHFNMAIVSTNNKWEALQAFINMWLQDKRYYCNHCGKDLIEGVPECCENPQVGRNLDHTRGLIKQNKEMQTTRKNTLASTADKSMRWGVSMPPKLYMDANNYFRKMYKEKLFQDKKELREFMKQFPQFCIPEDI